MVLPLELLLQLKALDFSSQQEYEAWRRRNFKLLEAGLLLHPHLPLNNNDNTPKQLRQIIRGALDRPSEVVKNGESVQLLRNSVLSLACRSFDGSVSDKCHWADGFPFNLRIYQMLLEACFDVNDETLIIEEVDDVLELIKKTWGILGISQLLHNVCFLWILFIRYVSTGLVESDLLFAANSLLLEVEKGAKLTKDADYFKFLSSILSTISGWAEKRLLAYHDSFYSDNIDIMQSVVSLGVVAAKILADISQAHRKKRKEGDVARDMVDKYIRSSLRGAFAEASSRLFSMLHFSFLFLNYFSVKNSQSKGK